MNGMRRERQGRRPARWCAQLWQQALSHALGLLFLAMSLTLLALLLMSCGSQSTPPARVVKLLPPPVLLLDCGRPDVDLSTNATVIDSLLACHAQIVECNADRKGLREWAKTPTTPRLPTTGQ